MTTPTKFFEDEINLCNERITSIEHIIHGEMRIADEDSTALPMRRADWQRYRDALTTVRHYRPAWRCAATAWRFEERIYREDQQLWTLRCPLFTRGKSQMPRYYFHVRRGQMTVVDKQGVELADNVEAVQEAERRGREIATDEAGVIIVEDEGENRIAELPLDIH